MPLVYRCADAHDTTVAVGSDAPDVWTCCVCGQAATRISACERSSAEVAAALDDACAAFDRHTSCLEVNGGAQDLLTITR